MNYNYLLKTDIADCYSSIYTHSITWAMCDSEKAKQKRFHKAKLSPNDEQRYKIGNSIDSIIQDMSYKQTNSIPQGSVLMDFIAELVLGYADKELSEKLTKECPEIVDYKILRYRDDYRIYGKTQEDVVKIAKALTEVLLDLNLSLNTQKTIITQDLISDSIKPDKLFYLAEDYKQLELPTCPYNLQKHLLRIHRLSLAYPNSGALQKAMGHFFKRLCDGEGLDLLKEHRSVMVLLSILTNISYNSPRVYAEYAAIVSHILSCETTERRGECIGQILDKFHLLPNVGMLEVWLQRLTIKDNRTKVYQEKLCQCAAGGNTPIWNLEWLKPTIKKIFDTIPIVDEDKIKNLPSIIEYKEVEHFNKY